MVVELMFTILSLRQVFPQLQDYPIFKETFAIPHH